MNTSNSYGVAMTVGYQVTQKISFAYFTSDITVLISNQLLQFTLTILGKQQIISVIIPDQTKKKMSIKLKGMRLWNNLPTSLVEGKLKLVRKSFVKPAKKHFLNLLQQSCKALHLYFICLLKQLTYINYFFLFFRVI